MNQIDHIIYTSSNLEKGIKEVEKVFGVSPVYGGQHPHWGTHNSLLSLGESTYLEIIAPNLSLPRPSIGRLFEKNYTSESKLSTWAVCSENIEGLYNKATKNNLKLGAIEQGNREKSDGTLISWRLTNPYTMPLNGAVPFLIEWGKSVHPACTAPKAGELLLLEIEHPDPDEVRKNLKLLEMEVEVIKSKHFNMVAKIETQNGIITLK
ncbi:MAG: VOC family protein [Bacteroidota bacterium]